MLFLNVIYVLVAIAMLVLALVTQVLIPMRRGSVLFPFFRKTQVTEQVVEAEHKLEELADAERLKQLNDEIQRREAQLKETK